MLSIGSKKFSTFLEYYTYVMNRYFRRSPPIPVHFYLTPDSADDITLRMQIARLCHFPSIINILANDESELVRQAARENEFWQLIGNYQDILGFGRKERLRFARTEVQFNLIVLLMFEDDTEIINEVLHNSAISLKVVSLFNRLLKERGRGRKDAQIFEMSQQILQEKKEQIVKLSLIKKAAKGIDRPDSLEILLKIFIDNDPLVRQAIHNILSQQDVHLIRRFVYTSLDSKNFLSLLDQFVVLSELLKLVNRREDFRKLSMTSLALDEKTLRQGKYLTIADFFIQLINKKRRLLVQICAQDLTNFSHIIILTYCHVDADADLRMLASEIISVNEILNLVNEVSTPRKIFKEVLNILDKHSDEAVVERAHSTFLLESQRLRESLKELEITVQAYFNIIFQSAGYRQINAYQDVIKSLRSAENQIKKFEEIIARNLNGEHKEWLQSGQTIKQLFQNKANRIYYDTSPKTIRELEYIVTLIEEIFNLKNVGLASLRPGTPEDIESEMRVRARTIWQSAISSYLGRIKDLTEMISKKMAKVAVEQELGLGIEEEIKQAVSDLEKAYKQRIQCRLAIPCAVCSRRGCAAERFLTEAHFFLQELLDNFSEVHVANAKSLADAV